MDKTISLLPFIESERGGFLLDIPLSDRSGIAPQGYSYPFQIVDNGQNYSILLKAGLKVKYSSHFKSFFLLAQRDHYPISPDDLNPVTNADIERIWLETIQTYSTGKKVFYIPNRFDRDGEAAAFKPLFFCRKEAKFFHPPCPECGEMLDLCKDDGLLKSMALFPYNTTLKRYLFCPGCSASNGNHIFYQFARSSDDRVFVKDRVDLIKDFSRLRGSVPGRFPCPDCPWHAECYITGEKAASRIGFFSFYPFYMLLFDAAAIKAVDFIPLISGAPLEEIMSLPTTASGYSLNERFVFQEDSHFFFKDDNRFCIEILYLKLSFLEKFIRSLDQRFKKNPASEVKLSANSIWVSPQTQGSLLPFFWEFSLSIIDLISNSSRNSIESSLTRNRNFNFIVSLWFYTFLVNKNQGQNDVYNAIGRLPEKGSIEDCFSDYDKLVQDFPIFALENIFWNPRTVSAPPKWYRFWLKTLLSGAAFLKESNTQDLKEGLTQLLGEIGPLKQEVKEELFSTQITAMPKDHIISAPLEGTQTILEKSAAEADVQLEERTIASILKQLKSSWINENPSSPVDLEDDVFETIVLSSPEETKPNTEFDDHNEKTMIISAPETKPDPVSDFDEMDETVVLSRPETGPDSAGDFDTMEKTVIMSPGEKPKQDEGFFDEDDDLDKTIVITPNPDKLDK